MTPHHIYDASAVEKFAHELIQSFFEDFWLLQLFGLVVGLVGITIPQT